MTLLIKVKLQTRKIFIKNRVALLKTVAPFKKYKVKDSIIISSETRSGSTWLLEMLYTLPGTIINWEPLHELKGVVPGNFKWGERPYIPENTDDKKLYHFLEEVLRFKLFSRNSVRYSTFKDIFTGKQVLTKMVRSNLLLPYIVKNFNLKHKPIYLLRHPIAVSKSQNRTIEDDQYDIRSFQVPDTLNNERYKENFSYIKQLKSILERRVALWCIHNMEIINHAENGKKWVTVYYENLVMDTESELLRISKEMKLDLDVKKINFEKPSSTDFFHEFEKDKLAQLSKWKKGLCDEDLENIQKIFDHYELKSYSAFEILPQNNT